MFTHVISRGWSASGSSITKRIEITGGGENNRDEAIPPEAETLLNFSADLSQLKSLFIVADQPLTLSTNAAAGAGAANTILLEAGKPYVWAAGDAAMRDTSGTAMTVDITSLYVDNQEAVAAQLQIRCLIDPTV